MINRIVTVAKLIPILVFVVIVLIAFDAGHLRRQLLGR